MCCEQSLSCTHAHSLQAAVCAISSRLQPAVQVCIPVLLSHCRRCAKQPSSTVPVYTSSTLTPLVLLLLPACLLACPPCCPCPAVSSPTTLTITCNKPDNGWVNFGTARRRLLAPIQDLWEFDLGDSLTEQSEVTSWGPTPRFLPQAEDVLKKVDVAEGVKQAMKVASTGSTFRLTVTASAGTPDCGDSANKPADVTVIPKGNIGIDVSQDQKICSNATDEQLVFGVTLTGDDVPVNVSLTTDYAGCKLYSDTETTGANHIDFGKGLCCCSVCMATGTQ